MMGIHTMLRESEITTGEKNRDERKVTTHRGGKLKISREIWRKRERGDMDK
jgi:hypothetical protein